MTASPERRASIRREAWFVVGLLLITVGIPLAVSILANSTEVPRNDDWSYRRIAVDLAQTGRFALDGISETMIIGQILITQPLLWLSGQDPWAFAVAGALFAAAGSLSAYALARQLLVPRLAVIPAAILALFPGYLAYSTSYMSDVPALAAQFMCLTFGAIAIRGRVLRMRWLVASAAFGIVGFSIREFAIAAPACVFLAAILAAPRDYRIWLLGVGTCLACVGLHFWRASLPGQLPPVGPGYGSVSIVTQAFSSIAFVVAPAALVGALRWRRHLRRIDVIVGVELGLVLAGARVLQLLQDGAMPPVILDNLASQWGVPARPYLVGGRPALFSDEVWTAVNALAMTATVIVLAIGAGVFGAHVRRCGRSPATFVRRMGTPAGILVLFGAAVFGGLFLFGLSRPLFDRYFWPVVPPLAALFLFVPGDLRAGAWRTVQDTRDRLVQGSAIALTVVLCLVSGAYLLNSSAFDAARWKAGEELARAGLSPDTIDAGYEWVGYHATTPGDPTVRTSTDTFYRSWWAEFRQCGIVSSAVLDRPDVELIGTTHYDLMLLVGPTTPLYLYQVLDPACG